MASFPDKTKLVVPASFVRMSVSKLANYWKYSCWKQGFCDSLVLTISYKFRLEKICTEIILYKVSHWSA